MNQPTGKIRNVSGESRSIGHAGGRLVLKGATLDVPLEEVYGYTQQDSIWEPADADAQSAHDEAHADYQRRLAEDLGLADPEPEQPAGNASRDDWAGYVLAAGLATEDDLEGLNRDQIRDTYKQEG